MISRHLAQMSALCIFIVLLSAWGAVRAETIFIAAGSDWKYLDDGSDQGTAWRDPAFVDTAWAEGPAQLGYGDGDEATVVSYGPNPSNKYITTYFRRGFDVADPGIYVCLRLRLLRDDGAVVYLNGAEVRRSNMPDGPIGYSTPAVGAVGGDEEDAFQELYFYSAGLVAGGNLLAVEIHQQSGTSSDISFDLSVVGLETLPSLVRKQPYLVYSGVNTEMDVHWQLSLPESCTIEWGPDTLYSMGNVETGVYGSDFQHKYTITGLTPGTRYYYRVTAGTDQFKGSFRAAPQDDATSVKLFAYGDCRTYPAAHNLVCQDIISTYAADPDFRTIVLSMGDLISDGDSEADWDGELFVPTALYVRGMFADLPYQSCMGNHEESGILFKKYLPYPFVGGRYWSFDYGPVHVAVVDQYVPYGAGSPQLIWLENDLASTTKPWKFVCLHEPGWSAGGHANDAVVQTQIHPLLVQYGAIILFAGHNHYYARALVNDIHHVTTGGGGAPLYTPDPGYPYVVATSKTYHFCTIDIDGTLLHFEAINTGSSVVDSFTVVLPGAAVPGEAEGQGFLMLAPPSPSPFTGSTTLEFALPRPVATRLEIFDIHGRKVRTLFSDRAGPGSQSIAWDGTDDAGNDVSAGAYLCRLQAGDLTACRKVVKLR